MTSEPTRVPRIPLFPLEVVLFPAAPLPLHIFEPRYKQMIGLCLEKSLEFGVVLQKAGEVVTTGCTAQILEVLQKYPDGRMDILTIGRSRFQIEALLDEKAYHEARVVYVADELCEEIPAHRIAGLLALFDECYRAVHGRGPEPPDSPESLAYHIADALPVELEIKQSLLELRSEASRQEYLFSFLTHWLPRLRRVRQVKARAGGNGHG